MKDLNIGAYRYQVVGTPSQFAESCLRVLRQLSEQFASVCERLYYYDIERRTKILVSAPDAELVSRLVDAEHRGGYEEFRSATFSLQGSHGEVKIRLLEQKHLSLAPSHVFVSVSSATIDRLKVALFSVADRALRSLIENWPCEYAFADTDDLDDAHFELGSDEDRRYWAPSWLTYFDRAIPPDVVGDKFKTIPFSRGTLIYSSWHTLEATNKDLVKATIGLRNRLCDFGLSWRSFARDEMKVRPVDVFDRESDYREQITGVERGSVYRVGDVAFHGWSRPDRALLVALDLDIVPVGDLAAQFKARILEEAAREEEVVRGQRCSIEWHVPNVDVARWLRSVLDGAKLGQIVVVHTPRE